MGILDRFKRQPAANVQPDLEKGERMVIFEGLGMHWAGCKASVEAALLDVPGVSHVMADLARQTASVIFDSDLVSVASLRDAIEQVGFPPSSLTEPDS